MRIRDCMSKNVEICRPDDSLQDVARKMATLDCGVMPVAEGDRLAGVITDRDIAIRAVALGKGPDTLAGDTMSPEVLYCYDDQPVDEVSVNMAALKIRRMPVVDREKQLVGIVSLGDLSQSDGRTTMSAFQVISERGGPHSQTPS